MKKYTHTSRTSSSNPQKKSQQTQWRVDPEKLQLIWAGVVSLAVGAAAIYHTHSKHPPMASAKLISPAAVQRDRVPAQNQDSLDENILQPTRSDL